MGKITVVTVIVECICHRVKEILWFLLFLLHHGVFEGGGVYTRTYNNFGLLFVY